MNTFKDLTYDRTVHRASSPTRELAPGLLAPARSRQDSRCTPRTLGFDHTADGYTRLRDLQQHFQGFQPMTEPYTERLHRRVNWPPGSWHPPDRGRILDAHLGLWGFDHTADGYTRLGDLQQHFQGFQPMTEPYTERSPTRELASGQLASARSRHNFRCTPRTLGAITPRPVKPDREISMNTFKEFNL